MTAVLPIPKKLHLIWVGDDSRRPDKWIQSWRDNHAGWEFKLWGNDDYRDAEWSCRPQMEYFAAAGHWEGVADIMRYEILYRHGGFYADADSVSVSPVDDLLPNRKMFAVWASERHHPGQISNGFIGSVSGHPVLAECLDIIRGMKDPLYVRSWFRRKKVQPWKTVGPALFTSVIARQGRQDVDILPSIFFIPQHFRDTQERVPDAGEKIYARHLYGTTFGRY